MRLRFTPEANRQLDRVLSYITVQDPQRARRVQARIAAMLNLILAHPQVGPVTAKPPRRRLIATPYPYAITYRVDEDDDEIIVLGIRHTARRPN